MDKIERIGALEAICLIITVTVNQIIFNAPNLILQSSGSSAWINVIYISIIAIIFTYIIFKIFKNFPSSDIVDISDYLGGKILKYIIGIAYIAFFFIVNFICICYFANALKLIYFHNTPLVILLILFIIPPIVINKYGLKSISSVNLAFIPFVFLSIIILFIGASSEFDFNNIFPLFGFGVKETFLYGFTNLFSFSGIGFLFFLNPFLKKHGDFKKIAITSIIISALYLFLSVLCLLLSYYFMTTNDQLSSLYLLTRMVEFGTFLQRVDAIFILIWILNNFSFTAISTFFIITISKKLIKVKDAKQLIYPLSALTFSLCLAFNNIADIKYFAKTYFINIMLILIFIISLIILIFANIKLKRQKTK